MKIPWKDAAVHEGTIPQQEILFPRPVILGCADCAIAGFWYPGKNKIDTGSRSCQTAPGIFRNSHCWGVVAWNGNAPQEAPLADDY